MRTNYWIVATFCILSGCAGDPSRAPDPNLLSDDGGVAASADAREAEDGAPSAGDLALCPHGKPFVPPDGDYYLLISATTSGGSPVIYLEGTLTLTGGRQTALVPTKGDPARYCDWPLAFSPAACEAACTSTIMLRAFRGFGSPGRSYAYFQGADENYGVRGESKFGF